MSIYLMVFQYMKTQTVYTVSDISNSLSLGSSETRGALTYLIKGGLVSKINGHPDKFKTNQEELF